MPWIGVLCQDTLTTSMLPSCWTWVCWLWMCTWPQLAFASDLISGTVWRLASRPWCCWTRYSFFPLTPLPWFLFSLTIGIYVPLSLLSPTIHNRLWTTLPCILPTISQPSWKLHIDRLPKGWVILATTVVALSLLQAPYIDGRQWPGQHIFLTWMFLSIPLSIYRFQCSSWDAVSNFCSCDQMLPWCASATYLPASSLT